jgi:hypothetical protein
MTIFQTLRSPDIPLTSFHVLPVFLISSSIVFRHVLFALPILLYPFYTPLHHVPTVKPEAATAVVELLILGVRTPETN